MENEVTEVTPVETATEAVETEETTAAPAAPIGAGNTPEKLQKVMAYLNARIAADEDAITDEAALDAIINEPDDDDSDDFESDDSDSFDDSDDGDDDFEDLDDDETPDNIVADLGVTNDNVDVDDLEDLF